MSAAGPLARVARPRKNPSKMEASKLEEGKEMRCGDEVAGFRHLASDRGVARFVGADQADRVQAREIADVKGREDNESPYDGSDAGDRWARFGGRLSGRRRLHAGSLT